MQKIIVLIGLLGLLGNACQASNIETIETQQGFNDNRAVIGIQKQPAKENKQEARNNWFCIILQVNGKVKDIPGNNNK